MAALRDASSQLITGRGTSLGTSLGKFWAKSVLGKASVGLIHDSSLVKI